VAKDEASVAPKEMVNIRLPAPADGAEGEELPFRLAIVGDFTGKEDTTPVSQRKLRNINQKNFNDIMASMEINASYSVKNTISGREGEEIPIDLKIEGMKSFRPDEVAKQVPQIRELVEFRKKLINLRAEAVRNPEKLKELNDVLSRLGMDKPKEGKAE
jgi:type VI secretion system protein ImpB